MKSAVKAGAMIMPQNPKLVSPAKIAKKMRSSLICTEVFRIFLLIMPIRIGLMILSISTAHTTSA